MDKRMRDAIDAVFEKLIAIPQEQLLKEIDSADGGVFASIILYTGALEARAAEAEAFAPSIYPDSASSPEYKLIFKRNIFPTHQAIAANDYCYNSSGVEISLLDKANNEIYIANDEEGSEWKRVA